MERNNATNLAKFMHGLTTVFAGLQEMFASITEQITLASEASGLLEDAAERAAEIAEGSPVEIAEPAAVKYTAPVQKPKATRKRAAVKKAAPAEPVESEAADTEMVGTEPVDTKQMDEENMPAQELEETEEDGLPFKEEPEPTAEEEKTAAPTSAPAITKDMITKTVVAKIKKKRGNSEAIGKLVKTYGVAQLSDLPEEKYEAFLNDLSKL